MESDEGRNIARRLGVVILQTLLNRERLEQPPSYTITASAQDSTRTRTQTYPTSCALHAALPALKGGERGPCQHSAEGISPYTTIGYPDVRRLASSLLLTAQSVGFGQ